VPGRSVPAKKFAAFIRAETERWARVVKDANIPKQ